MSKHESNQQVQARTQRPWAKIASGIAAAVIAITGVSVGSALIGHKSVEPYASESSGTAINLKSYMEDNINTELVSISESATGETSQDSLLKASLGDAQTVDKSGLQLSGYVMRTNMLFVDRDRLASLGFDESQPGMKAVYDFDQSSVIAKFGHNTLLYEGSADSDYYVGFVDTTLFNDAGYISSAMFTDGNINNPQQLDRIIYDKDHGIVYVPKDIGDDPAFADEDGTGVLTGSFVVMYSFDDATASLPVEIENNNTSVTAPAQLSEIEINTFNPDIRIPVATPDTAHNITLSNISLTLGDIPIMDHGYGADNQPIDIVDYDETTGELLLSEMPVNLSNITVTIEPTDTLGTETAMALSYTDPDSMSTLPYCKGLPLGAADAGDLYTYYGSYTHVSPSNDWGRNNATYSYFYGPVGWPNDAAYTSKYAFRYIAERGWDDVTLQWLEDYFSDEHGDQLGLRHASAWDSEQYGYIAMPSGTLTKTAGESASPSSIDLGDVSNCWDPSYNGEYILSVVCVEDDETSDWGSFGPPDGTIDLRILYKTDSYAIISFISNRWGTTGAGQACGAIYKVKLGESKGKIEITKTSSNTTITNNNTSYSLSGAVYGIYNDSSCSASSKVGEMTTGTDGKATSADLTPGDYWVKEITAPAGFKLDTTAHKVTVNAGSTEPLAVRDDVRTPPTNYLPKKLDSGTSTAAAEGNASIAGAEFTVVHYGGQYTASQIASGKPAQDGVATRTWVLKTNSNGQIPLSQWNSLKVSGSAFYTDNGATALPLGTVTIKEKTASTGYNLNTTTYVTHIVASGTDGSTAQAVAGYTGDLNIPEEVQRGALTLTKYSRNLTRTGPVGDASLAGAKFDIINDSTNAVVVNGTSYAKGKVVLTITTDANGVAKTNDKVLPYGKYIVKEKATSEAGYLFDSTSSSWSKSLTISSDGQRVTWSNKSDNVSNDEMRGNLVIQKNDATTSNNTAQGDSTLQGAVFEIINKSAKSVTSPINGNEIAPNARVCTITTDATGKASTTNSTANGWSIASQFNGKALDYGTYLIREITAPTGYNLNSDWEQTITIRSDGQLITQTMTDTVKHGNIELVKYDKNFDRSEGQGDATLAGVSFDIINRSAGPVVSPEDGTTLIQPGKVVCRITTKKDGNVYKASTAFSGTNKKKDGSDSTWNTPSGWTGALAYGEYEVVEVKASTGYQLGVYSGTTQKVFHGIAAKSATYNASWLGNNGQKFTPDSEPIWINAEGATVKFDTKEHGPHDTVLRGDIELVKYDDTTEESWAQGDASLLNVEFDIINRSAGKVISPEDGREVAPGGVVCRIKTYKGTYNGQTAYIASTKKTGLNPKSTGSGTWDTPSTWHGALAYGQYEVVEVTASEGYMLGVWSGNTQQVFHGMATTDANYNSITVASPGKKFKPNGSPTWINADKAVVKFNEQPNGASNTVMRGDIELIKYDDDFERSENQGDATLAGAQFDIINRSKAAVVSPEDGTTVIQPGQVVCRITTKKVGDVYKASTAATGNQKKSGEGTWAKPSAWHGALAYGEYEIVEVGAPEGYMLGVYSGDVQTVWHGFATVQSQYDAQWLRPNGAAFTPSATPYWINADKVVVQFDDKDHGPHDTVKRGDVELVKYDDTLKRSEAQGNATLEDIQFDIINRSAGKVISPEDGREVAPGQVVCRITSKYIDGAYRASTKYTGINQNSNGSGTWDTPTEWHGALAYGQYQIKEVEPSIGYMLGHWNNDTQEIWNGIVSKNGTVPSSWNVTSPDKAFTPDSDITWVNDDKTLITFDTLAKGPNDTVMRGDIDVQKVDEELQRTEHPTDIQDRQGMARLDGCKLGVYNRSEAVVVSPEDGREVLPGELVCVITTDMDGIASTELTPERVAINGWTNCFAVANGWHGSLAYGEYEIIEQIPSEGYMLNKTWHGMAVDYTVSSPKSPIIEWPAHEGAEKESIRPNTDVTWIDADKVRVSFGNKVYGEDAVNQSAWLPEQVIRGGVRIGKVDRQNQDYKPQGKASLENHVIAIYSRNLHPVVIHELSTEISNRTAAAEIELPAWDPSSTVQSASNTTMALGTQTRDGVLVAYLNTKAVEENGQVKYIAETDIDTLPYGIYRIKEVFVPSKSGYLFDQVSADWYEDFAIGSDFSTREFANQNAWKLDTTNFKKDETYHTTVTQTEQENDRTYVDLTNDPKYCLSNYVLRGDVLIHKKVENSDSNVLQFTPFVIVSKTTGEAHIVVTDKNGDATTIINHQASTLQNDETGEVLGYTLHTFETDKNDEGVLALAEGSTIPALALDENSENGLADINTIITTDPREFVLDADGNTPDFQWAYGSWFNGRVDNVTENPRLTWQNADWPTSGSNYIAADVAETLVDDTLGALPFDDYIVFELKVPDREVTDLVDGETLNVMSNEKYMMVGGGTFAITTANGEYVNTDNPASRANREVIGWSNPTQADIRSGRYPQEVDFDNQKALTIGTQLSDEEGNHITSGDSEITLFDTIAYADAVPGTEYTIKGELHKVIYDADGQRQDDGVIAEREVTFVADKADGEVVAEFKFSADDAKGHVLVAFEYAYVNGKMVSWHEDIDDEGQTLGFSDMGTTLADGPDGNKEVPAFEPVHLIDTVAYSGLIPGKEYTVSGTLHVRNADGTDAGPLLDAEGNEITSSTTFTPELPDGTVEVAFDMDGSIIGGKVVVAFEDIAYEGRVFITHADINDEGQTVYSPGISTTALDGITSDHLGLAEGEITINDIVAYSNLVKGNTYTIDGTLMDRLTGEAIKFAEGDIVKGTKTFIAGYNDDGTPDENAATVVIGGTELVSGTVEVPFHPNAEDIKGKATVVFEELYSGGGDTPKEEGDHEVEISKTDAATGEELPGAVLVITKDGEEITRWVSEDTPHTVKLDEGTYELTEITAPKGYETTETIEFTVDENGLVDSEKVEMKDNAVDIPEGDHEVEISKTDMTTGEELPGATLIIVQDNVTIDEWVSEETPHTVKLEEGTYQLIEITAPDGYEQAETITFEVGPDGLVEGDKVEMKDKPVNEELVAIHEDINDDNQSVNYPEIRTMAHVNGAKAGVTAAGEVHLIDTVSYTNLIPGREYIMNGTLMDKVTGQPALTPEGQQITGTTVFTPETASGAVDMEFVFNARALQYHETVVFENVYTMRSEVADELIHVAKHEDINDADQTVGFGEDDLADELITATGDETGNLVLVVAAAIAALAGAVVVRRENR